MAVDEISSALPLETAGLTERGGRGVPAAGPFPGRTIPERWSAALLGAVFLAEAVLGGLDAPVPASALPALAAHGAVAALAAGLAGAAGWLERAGRLGTGIVIVLAAGAAAVLLAAAGAPDGYPARRFDLLLLILLSYALLPDRLPLAAAAAVPASVGLAILAARAGAAGPAELAACVLLLGLTNLAGIAMVRARRRSRRSADGAPPPDRNRTGAQPGAGAAAAEEAQRRHDRIIREILDAAPLPALVTRLSDSGTLYANRRAAAIAGLPPEDLTGRPWIDLHADPDDRTRLLAMLKEQGSVTDFETRLKTPQGKVFWALVSADRVRCGEEPALFVSFTDISRRKVIEEALRANELHLRRVLDSTSEWYVAIDPRTGLIIDVNAAMCAASGYGREELLGRSPTFMMDAENAALFREKLATTGSAPYRIYDISGIRKDGTRRDMLAKTAAVRDEAGTILFAFAFLTDITERRLAEAALRESEEKLRIISESVNDAVIMMRPDGTIDYWNPAAERMFGLRSDAALGQSVHALLAEAGDRDKAQEALPEFVRSGQGPIVGRLREVEAQCQDGSTVPVELSIAAIRLGGAWWAVGIARDITGRRHGIELLRRSELRLRSILESSPIAVYIASLDGDFLFCNARTEQLFGIDRERMFEMKTSTFYADDERSEVLHQSLLAERAVHDFEISFRRLDGRVFWAALSGWPMEFEGRPAWISWLYDISDRKLMEEELRRLATIDALTGLYNRRHFLSVAEIELERARRYGRKLAVLMLDIDRFKSINDSYGHPVGDETLRMLAIACRNGLRDTDLIGRLGGEEFAILLPETDGTGALRTAERLRRMLAEQVVALAGGGSLRFTA